MNESLLVQFTHHLCIEPSLALQARSPFLLLLLHVATQYEYLLAQLTPPVDPQSMFVK